MSGKKRVVEAIQEEIVEEVPTTGDVESVEEIVLPVEGSESECKVLALFVGPLGKFINIEKVRNQEIKESMMRRAHKLSLKIVCREKTTGEVFDDVIVFSFHPRARYPKIAARYGKIRVGDTLKCRVEGGRWKIV